MVTDSRTSQFVHGPGFSPSIQFHLQELEEWRIISSHTSLSLSQDIMLDRANIHWIAQTLPTYSQQEIVARMGLTPSPTITIKSGTTFLFSTIKIHSCFSVLPSYCLL